MLSVPIEEFLVLFKFINAESNWCNEIQFIGVFIDKKLTFKNEHIPNHHQTL